VKGVNSSMIYLIHCKNLCKCYNVPPSSTKILKNTFLAGRGGTLWRAEKPMRTGCKQGEMPR
jgi:hypothetical protein